MASPPSSRIRFEALAARQFTRIAPAVLRGGEADLLQQGLNAGSDTLFGPAFQAGDQSHVLPHREMREQAAFLNDIADAPLESDRIPVRGFLSLNQHGARAGLQQAVDQLENCRLSGAAPPQQDERLTGLNLKGQIVKNVRSTQATGYVTEGDDGTHE